MTRIIQDEQDFHRISMPEAVDLMRDALISVVSGTLVAPARHTLKVGSGGLTFTMGGETKKHQIAGFRVYDSVDPNATDHQHLTAVYDSVSGILKGLVVGRWVGDFRTGAIGGVAIDQLAHRDTRILGLIGTGNQARTQLQAALARQRHTLGDGQIVIIVPGIAQGGVGSRDIADGEVRGVGVLRRSL